MASFDLNTFSSSVANGEGLFAGGAAALGLPSCALELGELALALIPAPVLLAMDRMLAEWREKVDAIIKEAFNYIASLFGIKQYLTNLGNISLKLDGLSDLDFWLPAAIQAIIEAGADLYQNIQAVGELIEDIKACLDQIRAALETNNSSMTDQDTINQDQELARALSTAEEANKIKEKVVAAQNRIGNELLLRANDPNREPVINPKYAANFAGTTFKIGETQEEVEELIRLVYGPPQSREGQFLLSVDGLYYDSQGDSGLAPVLNSIRAKRFALDPGETWKFNFDPNIGGRGDEISLRNTGDWVGSIFDINLIDDSEMLQPHYEVDKLLVTLIGQKDKRVIDIKNQIKTLEGMSESILNNMKQGLMGEVAQFESKINRRKKQIEIAVKAPTIFGDRILFEPGKVPVNDFSYLQKYNLTVALDRQEKLVINTEEVSGIVLPLEPKFVKASPKNNSQLFPHLMMPDSVRDGIITDIDTSYADLVNPSGGPTLNIQEIVSTDGLFALYNFLNSDTVLPSSLSFNLTNCIDSVLENNGQLVAKHSKDLFKRYGLAVPYFEGITINSGSNPSALGTFAKLPDTRDFQDWTYKKSGFSFDCWTHVPSLTNGDIGWSDADSSGLYRLILANENTGIAKSRVRENDYLLTQNSDSSDYVKGMIVGFTIDQRWTKGILPSNNFADQDPYTEGYGFLIAPTISYDSSSVAFISKSACDVEDGWRGMYIANTKQTSSGKTLDLCTSSFGHLAFSVNYDKDLLTVYLDGEVLETSSVAEVFAIDVGQTVKLPSFKKENSFEYKTETVGILAPKSLKNGPRTYPFFTPWILGGGYTDGNALQGNFMGGQYGGQRSGLKGYLGSVKFYNKAIDEGAVKQNYDVQKNLFKTIKLKPKSVIIGLGQSNMDGYFVQMYEGFPPTLNPDIPTDYFGPQKQRYIWTPDSLSASSGTWKEVDALNTPNILYPTFISYPPSDENYGGLNASRYQITAQEDRFIHVLGRRHFDPMIPFMKYLANYDQQEVFLIKNAQNGFSITSGLELNNSPINFSYTDARHATAETQGLDVYYTLKNDVSAAIESLNSLYPNDYEIKAIFLIQGEFEALYTSGAQPNYPNLISGQVADNWGYSFSSLLYPKIQRDIKEMLGKPSMPDIPWLIGRIHIEMKKELPEGGIDPLNRLHNGQAYFTDNVRAQQEAIANDPTLNTYLVDMDGMTEVFDDNSKIHFLAEGQLITGLRFFEKYKEVIDPE